MIRFKQFKLKRAYKGNKAGDIIKEPVSRESFLTSNGIAEVYVMPVAKPKDEIKEESTDGKPKTSRKRKVKNDTEPSND